VSIRLNRLRLDRGTILAEDARHIESMRRDNRSARILAIPKVVAMQRLNLDLEQSRMDSVAERTEYMDFSR
jgi:hypothetical protein